MSKFLTLIAGSSRKLGKPFVKIESKSRNLIAKKIQVSSLNSTLSEERLANLKKSCKGRRLVLLNFFFFRLQNNVFVWCSSFVFRIFKYLTHDS